MENTVSRRELIKLIACAGLGAVPLFSSAYQRNNNTFLSTIANINNKMLERKIPSSGELLAVVGLGSWLQFDVGSSQKERAPLAKVLQLMLEKGGKLIDCSPMYGRAEEVIGDLTAASGNADQYFYATKVWTSGEQNGIDQMNASFRKLRRQTIDLMQVHNLVDWQTQLQTLKKWKEEGKVRYIGITHYTVSAYPQLEQIVRSNAVDFAQFNYSIRVREAEKRLLNICHDNGVAVIINEPFESGALFGMVKGKTLPSWAADYDINSWAQFFLKYIIAHPAVNCVIPGTSNPDHLVDNMGAGYGKLPDENGRQKMVEFIESI